jgi:large subunit ribosomal protein L18
MRKVLGKIKNPSLEKRYRRKLSIRKTLSGDSARPRVSISKSNKNLYVQAIDDTKGVTLVGLSSFGKKAPIKKTTVDGAKEMGKHFGLLLKGKKIETAVFDRNGFRYHGVVAAFADGIREAGIKL